VSTLQTQFDQFLEERQYLKNVTPRTVAWYELAFKLFSKSGHTELTQHTLQNFVIGLQRGVSPAPTPDARSSRNRKSEPASSVHRL